MKRAILIALAVAGLAIATIAGLVIFLFEDRKKKQTEAARAARWQRPKHDDYPETDHVTVDDILTPKENEN